MASPTPVILAAVLSLTLGACGNPATAGPSSSPGSSGVACEAVAPPNPDPPAGWGLPARTPAIVPVLITDPIVCGANRVLFSFIDANSRPAATPERSASLAIYELGRNVETPIATVQGEFVWAIEGFSGIYVTNLTFPSSGRYGAEFTTATAGGASETIRMTFDVRASSPTVKIGDHAPASKTPTLADVGGDIARISTDDDPDPAFYETSVDEALADHEPFALIFATPKFCKTSQCGPTLDRIKPFVARYPTVTFINVEPYKLTFVGGALEADLDANDDLQTVPTVDEWHLFHEPVVYIVDREGTVQGMFELIFSDDELTAVLDTVK